jgi:DNA-binding NarL/FixJ family response regulator
LVDLCLPDCQGIEALNLLLREAPHIPILVLSTPQEEEIAKLAVQRGAQDYLLKTRVDSYCRIWSQVLWPSDFYSSNSQD